VGPNNVITLRLPDGTTKQVAEGTRPREVAEGIGKRLAQAAVAAKVNGTVLDLERELSAALPSVNGGEVAFQILTDKDREALDVLRHSCAHVMARAVMRLFPGVQLAFGPTVDNGFYYDIDVNPPIREEDFPRIEAEMARIIKEAEPFERFERPTSEARALCADLGQGYKIEHIDDDLKQYPTLSFYRQGEFIDLCRGPHIPHAGKIGAFKILSIAGAYWKNDASRKQLQRLYGTTFFNQKDLDAYLKQLEEAKKRDHRVLGKQLKLFTISQMAGSGLILWMPRGATVRGLLETFIKDELIKRGYQPVYTPHIGRLDLYRTSGHFPYYADAQFPPMYMNPLGQIVDTWLALLDKGLLTDAQEQAFLGIVDAVIDGKVPQNSDQELPRYSFSQLVHDAIALKQEYLLAPQRAREGTEEKTVVAAKKHALETWVSAQEGYLVKPMNCPHHIQIYKAEPRSYRDLPVRLAEFGTVYRYEQTGELSGMTRVRGFTQDDAHLFVTPEQIETEMRANIELVLFVLSSLGLNDYRVRVGLRAPGADKYVGSDENWENAEKHLVNTVRALGMNYTAEEGEAAFYGPKIDFVVRDCIGREFQLGTVQLDYNLPERFDLDYIGSDNHSHRPVMIHRAPFGSMERFVGILIEHFAGAFPLWLAPEQVRVLPVSDKFVEYARSIEQAFKAKGFRVTGDYRPDTIGYKIREAQLEKIPYMLVVGEKEQAAGTVSVRDRVDGNLGAKPVAEVLALLSREVEEKRIRQVSTATAGLADTGAKYGE
jgi:threonyl-tRNA synthetase